MTKHEILQLAVGGIKPKEQELQVYEREVRQFNGCEFTFDIIGSSHYIRSREMGFWEMFSCNPIRGRSDGVFTSQPQVYSIPIDDDNVAFGVDREIEGTHTWVETMPPTDVFRNKEYDLYHDFGTDQVTAIMIEDGENPSYRTVHMYPEYDVYVHTATAFNQGGE